MRYEGRESAKLQSLHVMHGGQILHVDVKQVAIVHNGQEVILGGNGSLPEAEPFDLVAEFDYAIIVE